MLNVDMKLPVVLTVYLSRDMQMMLNVDMNDRNTGRNPVSTHTPELNQS